MTNYNQLFKKIKEFKFFSSPYSIIIARRRKRNERFCCNPHFYCDWYLKNSMLFRLTLVIIISAVIYTKSIINASFKSLFFFLLK